MYQILFGILTSTGFTIDLSTQLISDIKINTSNYPNYLLHFLYQITFVQIFTNSVCYLYTGQH